MYEGGILRMIIDDVNIVKHRRFRTSSSFGFEQQSLKIIPIKVTVQNEERLEFEVNDNFSNKLGERWHLSGHNH